MGRELKDVADRPTCTPSEGRGDHTGAATSPAICVAAFPHHPCRFFFLNFAGAAHHLLRHLPDRATCPRYSRRLSRHPWCRLNPPSMPLLLPQPRRGRPPPAPPPSRLRRLPTPSRAIATAAACSSF
ncbi:hypothetical protein [Oryza sativa Japonica Group]|uniref:Uncharacterized protein n=1 Tax=Oryza sativa subsp. japonica TaxID=39947 RepID=Q5VNL6_ORYSJ|nr:hypothetical protein [Oryza sativa Japonica Group]